MGYDIFPDECFMIPDNSYTQTDKLSEYPCEHYYQYPYQYFIKRTLARHSLHEGQKSLLEMNYSDYDSELPWVCQAELLCMELYLKCIEIKSSNK